jgi:hypothetical protein
VPSSAISQRPVIVFPSSLKVAVKRWENGSPSRQSFPLAVADAHLVDAADAALVGVQLEVRPVGRIASDEGDVVGRLGKLGRPTLEQMCPRVVPLEGDPSAARPRLSVGPFGLKGPFADQRLELA